MCSLLGEYAPEISLYCNETELSLEHVFGVIKSSFCAQDLWMLAKIMYWLLVLTMQTTNVY